MFSLSVFAITVHLIKNLVTPVSTGPELLCMDHSNLSEMSTLQPSFNFVEQILIELETALLDDKPHWYPLQTHDVSSIPLPRPSPYLPRRHMDTSGKKLQRKSEMGNLFLLVDL